MNFETIAEVVHPLLAWYRQNARVLPWRSNPEPYRDVYKRQVKKRSR